MNTIRLSDFDLQRLIDGRSTNATISETGETLLITFNEGSKRYIPLEKVHK